MQYIVYVTELMSDVQSTKVSNGASAHQAIAIILAV